MTWWRRPFRQPVVWGALCLALALPWYLAGNGMDLLPFLLTMVGGWLSGIAFVNFTLGMKNARRGVLWHVAGAVVIGVVLALALFGGGSKLVGIPEPARAAVFLLTMAAIPAAAWVWLGLLNRVRSARWVRPSKERPRASTPEWKSTRAGTAVSFSAIPLRMLTLGLLIAGVVVVVGSMLALALIVTDLFLHFSSSWRIIVLAGAVVAVPAYILFSSALKRRTVACRIEFDSDQLRVESGTSHWVIALRDLDRLVWGRDSDYARVEVRGSGLDLSLITGIARMPQGVSPQLPPLSERTLRQLSAAGLIAKQTRRPGLTVFSRG